MDDEPSLFRLDAAAQPGKPLMDAFGKTLLKAFEKGFSPGDPASMNPNDGHGTRAGSPLPPTSPHVPSMEQMEVIRRTLAEHLCRIQRPSSSWFMRWAGVAHVQHTLLGGQAALSKMATRVQREPA